MAKYEAGKLEKLGKIGSSSVGPPAHLHCTHRGRFHRACLR